MKTILPTLLTLLLLTGCGPYYPHHSPGLKIEFPANLSQEPQKLAHQVGEFCQNFTRHLRLEHKGWALPNCVRNAFDKYPQLRALGNADAISATGHDAYEVYHNVLDGSLVVDGPSLDHTGQVWGVVPTYTGLSTLRLRSASSVQQGRRTTAYAIVLGIDPARSWRFPDAIIDGSGRRFPIERIPSSSLALNCLTENTLVVSVHCWRSDGFIRMPLKYLQSQRSNGIHFRTDGAADPDSNSEFHIPPEQIDLFLRASGFYHRFLITKDYE